MTVEDIKIGIKTCTLSERVYLADFLKHLSRKDNLEYQSDLGKLSKEIDDGIKFTLNQVRGLQKKLKYGGT